MDEKTICDAYAIFCEVFRSDMSYEAFRHKHIDNPDLDWEIPTLVIMETASRPGQTLLWAA